jgi:hypothetical protein
MSLTEKVERAKLDYDEVFDVGKQAEYDAFWDNYQGIKGNATYYSHRFAGTGWSDHTFKPKYNIRVVGLADRMFRMAGYLNLRQRLLDCGVVLDTSQGTSFQYAFANGSITALPKLDFSSATKLESTFSSSTKLTYIEEMVVHENLSYYSPFGGCTSLEHLIVTGTIGQNGFDVSPCPLDYESLTSIKNALADKSGDTSGTSWVITVGSDNKAKYTEEDKDEILQKGWVLK